MHNLSRARQRSTGHDGAVYWSGADVSGRPVRFSITMGWLHLRDSQSQRRFGLNDSCVTVSLTVR